MQEKELFRKDFAQRLSIIKMNFIFECIKKINNGKATLLDPGRFQDKKEALDIKE